MNTDPIFSAEAAAYAEMAATSTTAFRWMDQAGL
jgi:hypothetical protein